MGLRAKDLSVNVAIACWEWPSYMDPEKKEQGIDIIKSPYNQYENPLYSNNKIIGTYINSIMALQDALRKGADEALLLDKHGNISEGSGENLFIVKNGSLLTPNTDYCLNGITRQSVFEIADSMKLEICESILNIDDLINADEAFFTGTAVEVMPIRASLKLLYPTLIEHHTTQHICQVLKSPDVAQQHYIVVIKDKKAFIVDVSKKTPIHR